jgi:hypothetical protein
MSYPLDPELQPWLAMLPKADFSDLAAARAEARAVVAQMPQPSLDGLTVEDRTVPGPAGAPEVPVRIYRPESMTGPLPAILEIHGGGFALGVLDFEHATAAGLHGGMGRFKGDAASRSVEQGLIEWMLPAGISATWDQGTVAYLTIRHAEAEGTHVPYRNELGACAHGTAADRLAARLADQVQEWYQRRPGTHGPLIQAFRADVPAGQLPAGRVVRRRHSTFVISWPGREVTVEP